MLWWTTFHFHSTQTIGFAVLSETVIFLATYIITPLTIVLSLLLSNALFWAGVTYFLALICPLKRCISPSAETLSQSPPKSSTSCCLPLEVPVQGLAWSRDYWWFAIIQKHCLQKAECQKQLLFLMLWRWKTFRIIWIFPGGEHLPATGPALLLFYHGISSFQNRNKFWCWQNGWLDKNFLVLTKL